MKTNKLEHYVKENRKAFDLLEPPAGLWDKIEKELDKQQPKKRIPMYTWMSAAASIIVVFGLIWMYTAKTNSTANPDLAAINPAYAKKEVHFVNLIEEKRDSLEYYAKSNPELYKKFNEDLSTLDKEYEKLKKELPASPNQQFTVKAMMKNREMQVQILNQQLQVINQVNQYKNEKENTL